MVLDHMTAYFWWSEHSFFSRCLVQTLSQRGALYVRDLLFSRWVCFQVTCQCCLLQGAVFTKCALFAKSDFLTRWAVFCCCCFFFHWCAGYTGVLCDLIWTRICIRSPVKTSIPTATYQIQEPEGSNFDSIAMLYCSRGFKYFWHAVFYVVFFCYVIHLVFFLNMMWYISTIIVQFILFKNSMFIKWHIGPMGRVFIP